MNVIPGMRTVRNVERNCQVGMGVDFLPIKSND